MSMDILSDPGWKSGPTGKPCPTCGSSRWANSSDCIKCGKGICSKCAEYASPSPHDTDLICPDCEIERGRETVRVLGDSLREGRRKLEAMHAVQCAECASTKATVAEDRRVYGGQVCCGGLHADE